MAREHWASRAGFILAAVGSAVGLGNIWRFPWMTAENGGSAFLLVYLVVVLGVGVPGLLGEFVLGRRTQRNPVGALATLGDARGWGVVGGIAVVTSLSLLSFYGVVGGWILRYFGESLLGLASGEAAYSAAPETFFGAVSVGADAFALHLLFVGLTGAIVYAGVRNGIEVATKLMMPAILVLLVALAGWVALQPGADAGYAFFLSFDLETAIAQLDAVLVPAAGQALFTLSLGAGTMITYASYLGDERSLAFDGTVIAVLNTGVGVLAGLVVFPLLFSLGRTPGTGGPGALFVSLAGAFARLPAGDVLGVLFFGVVTLASLSSSISMLEIPVSFLVDEVGVGRHRAVAGTVALVALTGVATAFDATVFAVVAGPVVDTLLSLGLLAFLLFAAWVAGPVAVDEYRRGAGPLATALTTPWLAAVGVVIPVFLAFTLLTSVGLDGRIGAGPTVAVAVAAVALALVALRRVRPAA
jgi:NSS family neurotransmitter:Na+ symporter